MPDIQSFGNKDRWSILFEGGDFGDFHQYLGKAQEKDWTLGTSACIKSEKISQQPKQYYRSWK